VNTYDDTITQDDITRAARNIAATAELLDITLGARDATSLAMAALATFTDVLVVEDETSAGLWKVAETRNAIRRRLRDQAAVTALDQGDTLAAHPVELVHGVGPAGENVPIDEADTAVVAHTYYLRPLLPRPESDPDLADVDVDPTTDPHPHPQLRLIQPDPD